METLRLKNVCDWGHFRILSLVNTYSDIIIGTNANNFCPIKIIWFMF